MQVIHRSQAASPILPDLLRPGLQLVFCGTAPSRASAAAAAYYAHPGNAFWRALFEVGITPRQLAPAEYPQLLALNIGLTDLAKQYSGVDADLPKHAFDVTALHEKIKHYRPSLLAFTSKNAAKAVLGSRIDFGIQAHIIDSTRIFVLPSPSGQARRSWNIAVWRALAAQFHPPGSPSLC